MVDIFMKSHDLGRRIGRLFAMSSPDMRLACKYLYNMCNESLVAILKYSDIETPNNFTLLDLVSMLPDGLTSDTWFDSAIPMLDVIQPWGDLKQGDKVFVGYDTYGDSLCFAYNMLSSFEKYVKDVSMIKDAVDDAYKVQGALVSYFTSEDIPDNHYQELGSIVKHCEQCFRLLLCIHGYCPRKYETLEELAGALPDPYFITKWFQYITASNSYLIKWRSGTNEETGDDLSAAILVLKSCESLLSHIEFLIRFPKYEDRIVYMIQTLGISVNTSRALSVLPWYARYMSYADLEFALCTIYKK